MTRKSLLGIGVVIAVLAAALGAGLVLAQQEGGSDESTEVNLRPLAPPPKVLDFQGRITDAGGTPVPDGAYSVVLRIYDVPVAGVPLYEETHPSVGVADSFFSLSVGNIVPLDPTLFDLSLLYMGVEVGADGEMAPRIRLNYVPYALRADVAASSPWAGMTGVPAGFADGIDDVGGGGDSWLLAGNAGTTPGTDFLGTTDNVAFQLHVNSIRALRIEPTVGDPNIIGGFSGNNVTSGAKGATISGGGTNTQPNAVTDDYGTIGGGERNQAGNNTGTPSDAGHATIGGGILNTASAFKTTVGGGSGNVASSQGATVSGGELNAASGLRSTIGGGESNFASADYATVGGGLFNDAAADFATIAGGGWTTPGNLATANYVYDDYGTIGGGGGNTAGVDDANTTNQPYTTVSGGRDNTASDDYATVSGGWGNSRWLFQHRS